MFDSEVCVHSRPLVVPLRQREELGIRWGDQADLGGGELRLSNYKMLDKVEWA